MSVAQGFIRGPPWTECRFKLTGKKFATDGFAASPLIGNGFPMMPEKAKIEPERAALFERQQRTHRLDKRWATVGSEAHQLVFVTVMRKPQVLSHRLIENAKRMRKQNPAVQ